MRRHRGWIGWVVGAVVLLVPGLGFFQQARAGEFPGLAYYRQAKINWRAQAGATTTIGLNKHPYTESLLPQIPEFEALTGIKGTSSCPRTSTAPS